MLAVFLLSTTTTTTGSSGGGGGDDDDDDDDDDWGSYGGTTTTTTTFGHTRLQVNFDSRLGSAAISLPGVPEGDSSGFVIHMWRRATTQP